MDSRPINMTAALRSVLAIFWASALSFPRYSVKTGIKAAARAPAMNRLKSVSGMRKEAL